ncbi:unnamed protein product [marine sediment metagenome]|uniref:tRNA (guanine-N(1)-)-methyltransferase C-terminal domain-containing protein n=1 Tax=marine sediment metagenome TaxID=412755 RepID=X0XP37_9ZZZZ
MAEIKDIEGEIPVLMATDAGKDKGKRVNYKLARQIVASNRVIMILFGTGWGIAKELIKRTDYLIEPILGASNYNHLSVRTAAAITLDRLFSRFAKS